MEDADENKVEQPRMLQDLEKNIQRSQGRLHIDEMEHYEISLKYFDILGILGEGAFGKVKRIERKKKHVQYALKYINKKRCIEKNATNYIFRERMVLQSLQHQYIANLKYAFQDDENLFMVIDLAEGGDLRCHLDRLKFMKEDTLIVYTAEISCALAYLHSNRIIHRDLKPENLLLDKDGHMLVTDFNVCANLKDSNPTSPSGTMPYMAPEMFIGKPYNYSVDWWSVGIILYECTWGRRPYKVGKDWTFANFESVVVPYPDMVYKTDIRIPPSAHRDAFIKGLLSIDKMVRLGSSNHFHGFEKDIKCHPWLETIDWNLIEQKKLQPNFRPNAKALNIDSVLLIDEIIGGGDGLAYKERKIDRKPSAFSKAMKEIKKILRIKVKEPLDPNAPPPKLSPEEQQMADMDKYYTTFNWELPDQKPMTLPPKPKKAKKKKDAGADAVIGQPPLVKDDEKQKDVISGKNEASVAISINQYQSDPDLLNQNRIQDVVDDPQDIRNDVLEGKVANSDNIVFNVVIPETRAKENDTRSKTNPDVKPEEERNAGAPESCAADLMEKRLPIGLELAQ